MLDKFTRECLTIDVARKLPSGAKRDSWSYQRDFAHPSFAANFETQTAAITWNHGPLPNVFPADLR
ncbi:MAG TPA: hypothetical protein VHV55_15415, partial [Pirellulales bacterium]|nr:hypothetical protein [Pirellulales bacterium]